MREFAFAKRSVLINKKDITFHQDNGNPVTLLKTRQKLKELGWEGLTRRLSRHTIACFTLFGTADFENALRNHLVRFFTHKS